MIKKYLLLLVIAGLATYAQSQTVLVFNSVLVPPSPTETMFNLTKPGTLPVKFDFLLGNGNKMTLEFYQISQLDSLPNIDSLLAQVWRDLQNFNDSLSDPLTNRRVDYYMTAQDVKVRIINYAQKGDVYSIKGTGITQLKIEQDTLRIRRFTYNSAPNKGWYKKPPTYSYYINLCMNSINELPALISSGKAGSGVSLVKDDLAKKVNQKKTRHYYNRYYAFYDMTSEKRLAPARGSSIVNYGEKSITLPPHIQGGIQYVRGNWGSSAGLGFDLINNISPGQQQVYSLIVDNYFFFSRNTSGKTVTDRNTFLFLKYSYDLLSTKGDRKIEFSNGFGIGYLIRRRGDWFEPHTFKVSISGIRTKRLLLEPEFYFNDLFKNFSPSLKLTVWWGVD